MEPDVRALSVDLGQASGTGEHAESRNREEGQHRVRQGSVSVGELSRDLVDLPRTDEPILHRGRVLSGRNGYVAESRELWSADGRLLAHNQQTVVIIR